MFSRHYRLLSPSNRTRVFFFFTTIFAALFAACGPAPALMKLGLVTPATPDPYARYRAILQPHAQFDIETVGPLPEYHITAQLNEAQTAINGVMQVVAPGPGSELVFRLYPNLRNFNGAITVNRAKVDGVLIDTTPLANNSALRLEIPRTEDNSLPDSATVELAFTTQLGKAADTNSDYTLFGWSNSILSLPGFFPALAVQQGGAWVIDEPPEHADALFNKVALYQLDITLPQKMEVVAGGVTLNVIDNPNDSRTWQITGGPLRDITVIAGPFRAAGDTAAGAVVTSYYLPEHEAAGLSALAHATASLRLYNDIFGSYPYTKLDVVEAPLAHRGMEYSGLIMIGTDLYEEQRELLTFLVAHEVAHQWWYAVVGNNPYQHPWLDEGLAEYSAFDYYRGVFGRDSAEQLLAGRWQIPFATAAEEGGLDGTVDQPAATFDPVTYELLVYSKAALFFNALRTELGDEMYHKFIQTYYAENRYRITTPQTLLATAERVSGKNLNPLTEAWLR